MSDTPSFDEIPVLTEVVAEPAPDAASEPASEPAPEAAVEAAIEAAPEAAIEAEPVPVLDTVAMSAAAPDADDAWRTLEERLVARVLDRLQPRIDVVLEDQLRGQMAIARAHVAERLGVELRAALQQSIEHVVARAVQQELAHLNARQA
jgi:hypothetical protein